MQTETADACVSTHMHMQGAVATPAHARGISAQQISGALGVGRCQGCRIEWRWVGITKAAARFEYQGKGRTACCTIQQSLSSSQLEFLLEE